MFYFFKWICLYFRCIDISSTEDSECSSIEEETITNRLLENQLDEEYRELYRELDQEYPISEQILDPTTIERVPAPSPRE